MSRALFAAILTGGALSLAPAAYADRIVIPVFQNQTAINNGSQGQYAGGGYGNTSQTGVLNQSNQQSQAVNVYVPDDFHGSVRTTYVNRPIGNSPNFNPGERRDRIQDWRDARQDRRDVRQDRREDRRDNRGWPQGRW